MKNAYEKPDLELVSFNILATAGNSQETATESPIPVYSSEFDPDADFD